VLVDLVGHDDEVPLDGEVRDGGQLGLGQHRAGGVVRAVEQDQPGPVGDRRAQPVEVQPEVRRPEGHRHPHPAGHLDAGGVGVVERLERHHFVARVDQPEQRSRDRLGRAGRHDHLGRRVQLEAVEPLLVLGDRQPQVGLPGAR